MGENNVYKSLPLNVGYIRIFKIEPGKADEELKGTLSVIPLYNSPCYEYEALSYVWGPQNPPDHIFCDDNVLQITPNLGLALRRVRRLDKPRAVWIDALCINQSDNIELSHQVTIMRDIYDRATQVLVWLAEDNLSTAKDALGLVRKAAKLARDEAGSDVPLPNQIASEQPSAQQNKLRGFPAVDDSKWNAFLDLINRSWFERVWIMQEVSTSTQSLVMIGEEDISWTDIGVAVMWFSIKGYNGLIPGISGINRVFHIWGCRELPKHERPPLVHNLTNKTLEIKQEQR